jgi:serine/threonine protein kinase
MGCGKSLPKVKAQHSPTDRLSTCPSVISLPSNIPHLRLEDYEITRYLSSGGLGVVYLASHHTTHDKVALKFFGYVKRQIDVSEIAHELSIYPAVRDLTGVVRLEGICLDTADGVVSNKVWKCQYPILAMEFLEGGDLMDRIESRSSVCERYIARIFREITAAVDSLHGRGYLHCDLKLENVMFSSHSEDSPLKLIDLGMALPLPENGSMIVETEDGLRGTPGYYAPESILKGRYSSKSDVWQLGCVLYSLLSGLQAFSTRSPVLATQQIILGKYHPMDDRRGGAWSSISSAAKELIAQLLRVRPEERLSCEEILRHEWVTGGTAPETLFQENYFEQFSQLAFGQRLKRAFRDRSLLQNTREIQERLRRIIPLMRTRRDKATAPAPQTRGTSETHGEQERHTEAQAMDDKLKHFQRAVLSHSASRGCAVDEAREGSDPLQEVVQGERQCGDVDISEFISILDQSDLSELANPDIFAIFGACSTLLP